VNKKCKVSALKNNYPEYFMKKLKVSLKDNKIIGNIFKEIVNRYSDLNPNTDDGVRIDFPNGWVHMRKSNTEPIVRIFSESNDQKQADSLALKIEKEIKSLSK
jgi:phosphomannomutase